MLIRRVTCNPQVIWGIAIEKKFTVNTFWFWDFYMNIQAIKKKKYGMSHHVRLFTFAWFVIKSQTNWGLRISISMSLAIDSILLECLDDRITMCGKKDIEPFRPFKELEFKYRRGLPIGGNSDSSMYQCGRLCMTDMRSGCSETLIISIPLWRKKQKITKLCTNTHIYSSLVTVAYF